MLTHRHHWHRKATVRTAFALLLALTCRYAASRPLIIAHRAGLADTLENSMLAIETSLKNGAEIIWLSIQLSKDGEPVVYRPDDLADFTTGTGLVSQHTAEQLRKLTYKGADKEISKSPKENGKGFQLIHGGKSEPSGIPSLAQVLQRFPDTKFYLDMKSPDADPLQFGAAIDRTLRAHGSYQRTAVYSTNMAYSEPLKGFERIQRIAARDTTREILLVNLLKHDCIAAARERGLHGFELERDISIIEKFKLGTGTTKTVMRIDSQAAKCILSVPENRLILFGVNSLDSYQKAVDYGAFAVMVDSPALFKGKIQQANLHPCPTAAESR